MFVEPEYRGTVRGAVAADAFEHRTAIAHSMRENVDFGVVPGDKASVVPDFFGGRHDEDIISSGGRGDRQPGRRARRDWRFLLAWLLLLAPEVPALVGGGHDPFAGFRGLSFLNQYLK